MTGLVLDLLKLSSINILSNLDKGFSAELQLDLDKNVREWVAKKRWTGNEDDIEIDGDETDWVGFGDDSEIATYDAALLKEFWRKTMGDHLYGELIASGDGYSSLPVRQQNIIYQSLGTPFGKNAGAIKWITDNLSGEKNGDR